MRTLTTLKKQFNNDDFNQICNIKAGSFVMPLLDCGKECG